MHMNTNKLHDMIKYFNLIDLLLSNYYMLANVFTHKNSKIFLEIMVRFSCNSTIRISNQYT